MKRNNKFRPYELRYQQLPANGIVILPMRRHDLDHPRLSVLRSTACTVLAHLATSDLLTPETHFVHLCSLLDRLPCPCEMSTAC